MSTTLEDVSEVQPSSRSLVYPLVGIVSILWLLHRWQQSSRLHQLGNKLPRSMTLPFVGHALMALWVKPGTGTLHNFHSHQQLLPAGATVVIGTYLIHRDPKCYKDPEVFNPDNFLPENTQDRHYYSYIPFSAGPKRCVVREYAILKLKVLLANTLRNFKILADIPQDQFKLTADIILKRSDGFRFRVEPRMKICPSA